MPYQLLVIQGPDQGRCFEIEDGAKLTIGRGEKSHTQLDDGAVSRVHCELARHGDTFTLRDLGSSSGTLIEGKPIDQAEIRLGTVFKIGDTLIRLGQPKMVGEDTTIGADQLGRAPLARPLEELVGTTIGSYKIQAIIGRGVSGMVFKAHDQEKHREAALKVLIPQFSRSDEQRQRFVRAMKTVLPIKDPYIVRTFNAGITGPYCWAAMELVHGENLAQLIERIGIENMLDWKEVWHVAVNIGQALDTAYKHKIIHRNVTPTNILRRASDQVCLLGDLMLAKALEGKLSQQVTQPGQIIGEVPYMAPERTRPDTDTDTRGDMYGLGATCYALLTGRPPIKGSSLPELIDNIRNQIPDPPKQYQLAVNELFQDVIMRMLAKDPADRYQRPADLLGELIRIGRYNGLEVA